MRRIIKSLVLVEKKDKASGRLRVQSSSYSKVASFFRAFRGFVAACAAAVALAALTQGSAPAQDIDITFCGSAGCPYGQQPTLLIQASDSSLYGVSNNGSNDGGGNVFRIITSNGSTSLQNVYIFCKQGSPCADGSFPAALIEGSDDLFYGVTQAGGAADKGTVFKVDSSGNLTTLYSFCKVSGCADGSTPAAELIEGTDGNFYGLTLFGGSAQNVGTLFRITPQGMLTTLYTFCSLNQSCPDGAVPTALLQASDGNFYGTTLDGGTGNNGTVFRITPLGDFTSLYSFCTVSNTTSVCADGGNPGALVEGRDGNLYGVTNTFGTPVLCSVCGGAPGMAWGWGGTVFSITTAGALSTVYSFCSEQGTQQNCLDGNQPTSLMEGSDGNFYGTTSSGGPAPTGDPSYLGQGEIFEVTPAGAMSVVSSPGYFCGPGGGGALSCNGPSAPYSIMQLSFGDLTGVAYTYNSNTGSFNIGGATYEVNAGLKGPVQIALSQSQVSTGTPVDLTWQVFNGNSATLQQCYASLQGPGGGGDWQGLQTGTMSGGIYSGSATITPTVAGSYVYGLTCGGVESGFAPLTVNKGTTTTTLTSSNPSAIAGTSILFTATVAGTSSTSTPGGTVQFLIGSTVLGTANLSGGVGTLSISSLLAGTYSITAAYSGDDNFLPSTSSILQQVVLASDFTLSAFPGHLKVRAGDTGITRIKLTPKGGFKGAVRLTCSDLPADVTCVFHPDVLAAHWHDHEVSSTLVIETHVRHTGREHSARDRKEKGERDDKDRTPPGDYNITVTGTSSSSTSQVILHLTVTE